MEIMPYKVANKADETAVRSPARKFFGYCNS